MAVCTTAKIYPGHTHKQTTLFHPTSLQTLVHSVAQETGVLRALLPRPVPEVNIKTSSDSASVIVSGKNKTSNSGIANRCTTGSLVYNSALYLVYTSVQEWWGKDAYLPHSYVHRKKAGCPQPIGVFCASEYTLFCDAPKVAQNQHHQPVLMGHL